MMDFPLTLGAVARRAESLHGPRPVVSRRADRGIERTTYGDVLRRARRLALALRTLGVRRGDRVATLCWNHARHLEVYLAVPWMGAVLHTLNLRLHHEELAYIVGHAEDLVVVVDASLLPLWERVRATLGAATPVRHEIVLAEGVLPEGALPEGAWLDYEALLDAEDADAFDPVALAEGDAAALCYTSGTTGRPKGVLYSHRGLALHSFAVAMSDGLGVGERDTVLPVVPMFHANAWGLPYAAAMVGAGLALPGPHLDAASLIELLVGERVTIAAGVPTVWLALLHALDAAPPRGTPGAPDLSRLHTLVVGGAAAPAAMIRGFDRHGLQVVHAWGMTEMSPLGTVARVPAALADASDDARYAYRARQGRPVPFVEIRARNADGIVAWDGQTMGELEVRGPWVADSYYRSDAGADRFTADGWFRTGDIVTIAADGTVTIQDRDKDLIKSGGEWIGSVALENALMAHPAVAEAAVVAVPHPEWQERPLAVVVLKPGATADADALRAHLAPHFPSWWLPDAVAFVDAIPRTSTGKFLKSALRERFVDALREREGARR